MDGDTPKPMMPLPCPMERLKSFEERKQAHFCDEGDDTCVEQCSAAKAADAALAAKKVEVSES